MTILITELLPTRISSRLVNKSGCLVWDGYVMPKGYVQVWWDGRKRYLHRIAFELSKGEIGDGLQIDHLCRNRACCNPDHLEAVSLRENLLRGNGFTGTRARQTACVNGHPFNAANTFQRKRAQAGRQCRVCDKEMHDAARRAKGIPMKKIRSVSHV